MKIKIYQVDAFTDKLFGGNPAAVCPLDNWLPDEILQSIATENNLAETAYFIFKEGKFEIRWFTPTIEVELCGHATLAAAKIIFDFFHYKKDVIEFNSLSGILSVNKKADLLYLNFPIDQLTKIPNRPEELIQGLKQNPAEVYKGKSDYLVIFDTQNQIENLKPDFRILSKVKSRGIIVSAKGDHEDVDFVSRFFAPQSGIDEDPVTGSAHTSLIPYWSNALNKTKMIAKQLSKRKGHLECELQGQRVLIGGSAITYLTGEISI